MSLMKQFPGELPKDAVILSDDEALAYQMDLISNWDKQMEVWPLKSGIALLGIASSLTGIYINTFFRRKLKLGKYGYMSTYLPIVVLPGMASGVLHKVYITRNIILEEASCPLCLQTKSAALQTGVGFIYPLILAPLGNFMHATRNATYRLPKLTNDFFGVIRLMIKFAKPIGTQLSVLFIGHGILGSYFTYLEARSYFNVKQKMLEIEKEYEDSIKNSNYNEK